MLSTTFLLSNTFLLSQFSPPLQPMLSMIQVTRGHLRPYLTSIYQNFSPPLQPMLSTTTFLLSNTFLLSQFSPPLQPMLSTTFLLSNTFLLSQFSPPLCSPRFQWFRLPGVICDLTWLPFIKILSPLCSPCFQLQDSFCQTHSLYHNFPPPSAAHAFNYIPFIKHIPFITIFPPSAIFTPPFICSPCFQLQHSFYQTHSFYHNFPPLCSPCFQWFRLLGVICDLTWLPFIKIFPPSAAHAFNYNIPFIKNIPFITIFPPSAAHAFNYIPFIKNIPSIKIFPPPLQPMLSTTTFLLSKTFLLSQFSPPLQPMLSTTCLLSKTFLLSKFFIPPSAAHNFNYNIPFIKHIPFITIFPHPLQPMLSTTFLLSNTFLLSQGQKAAKFSPPLCSPCFQLQHSFYQTHSFYHNFPPLCSPCFQWFRLLGVICDLSVTGNFFAFIKYFPPLCSPCFQLQHSFYQKHSFYHNFPPLLQPMLSKLLHLPHKTHA